MLIAKLNKELYWCQGSQLLGQVGKWWKELALVPQLAGVELCPEQSADSHMLSKMSQHCAVDPAAL